MNFIPVAELPKPTKPLRTDKHDFRQELDKYMEMNAKYVRVDWTDGDYVSYNSACAAVRRAIWQLGIPAYATLIDSIIYLVRTDI